MFKKFFESNNLINAILKTQLVIHFDTDGNILWANEAFLGGVGYSFEEIKGKHHSLFVEKLYAESGDYKKFWQNLKEGHFEAGQFRRLGKGGKEVWLQATYTPIFNKQGKVYKVVKFASDITLSTVKTREAFDKIQALIYFSMDGVIQDANANFLKTMGYSLEEIKGKHHRMFCDPEYANSPAYADFWAKLNEGNLQTGEFQRFAKGGRRVWLHASYTIRYDNTGKPIQVIKYATDITAQKENSALEINKSIDSASSALQELSSSVTEIAGNISSVSQEASSIQKQTESSQETLQGLLDVSGRMGSVLQFIQDVSGQIDLLALNAAIEAARAGDAGRGFAVVADEVKKLAQQVGESSAKISQEIERIQHAAGDVASVSQTVHSSIVDLTEKTSRIANAVQEQSVVTQEISLNVTSISDIVNKDD